MSTMTRRTDWVQFLVLLCLTAGLSCATPAAEEAEEDKKKPYDAEAEKAQAKKEDEDQRKERLSGIKGKYQKIFYGTFLLLSGADKEEQPNPEVVGTFFTSKFDKNPGRSYLVKIDKGNPSVLSALKRHDGKQLEVTAKLRNADKYMIVWTIEESGPTQAPKDRSGFGQL